MRRLLLLSVVIIAVTVACGVPGPGRLESIDPNDVPFGLATTSTTSTTSTTTTTTIPLPTTTEVPLSTTTTVAETTTTLAATEPVDLYFVSGGGLFPISFGLPADADNDLILAALLAGPPAEFHGLRSAIPADAAITVRVSDGRARVDIPSSVIDEMAADSDNLRLMFGQIVLTLTPRCLGQVVFTFDGEEQPVYLADFSSSEPGQQLSCADYAALVSTGATSPTTTPPTTPPATSLPEDSTTVP